MADSSARSPAAAIVEEEVLESKGNTFGTQTQQRKLGPLMSEIMGSPGRHDQAHPRGIVIFDLEASLGQCSFKNS